MKYQFCYSFFSAPFGRSVKGLFSQSKGVFFLLFFFFFSSSPSVKSSAKKSVFSGGLCILAHVFSKCQLCTHAHIQHSRHEVLGW